MYHQNDREDPNGPDRFTKATRYHVLCGLASIRQKSN